MIAHPTPPIAAFENLGTKSGVPVLNLPYTIAAFLAVASALEAAPTAELDRYIVFGCREPESDDAKLYPLVFEQMPSGEIVHIPSDAGVDLTNGGRTTVAVIISPRGVLFIQTSDQTMRLTEEGLTILSDKDEMISVPCVRVDQAFLAGVSPILAEGLEKAVGDASTSQMVSEARDELAFEAAKLKLREHELEIAETAMADREKRFATKLAEHDALEWYAYRVQHGEYAELMSSQQKEELDKLNRELRERMGRFLLEIK